MGNSVWVGWWNGNLSSHQLVLGVPLYWWGRVARLADTIVALALLLEIVGERALDAFANRCRGDFLRLRHRASSRLRESSTGLDEIREGYESEYDSELRRVSKIYQEKFGRIGGFAALVPFGFFWTGLVLAFWIPIRDVTALPGWGRFALGAVIFLVSAIVSAFLYELDVYIAACIVWLTVVLRLALLYLVLHSTAILLKRNARNLRIVLLTFIFFGFVLGMMTA